jgi:ribosome-associated protein
LIARLALTKQADNVVIINIKKLSTVSDYIVVCSAGSETQVQAITRAIESGLKEHGERPFGIEGVESGRWALLDYSDVVAHIFITRMREYYDIDGLWAEAERTKVEDKPRAVKKAARTKKSAAAKSPRKRTAK